MTNRNWRKVASFLAAGILVGNGLTRAEDRSPAVVVRLIHPDEQLDRMLALFGGARAESPAAALSAWKRANPETAGFSKAAEAAIAALNPAMVRELRSLRDLT